MKFFSKAKDGGKDSTVWGFWFVEIKSLFSIVLLCFEEGSREVFHSHAFNAFTWFIKGEVNEHHLDGKILTCKPSFIPKYTPRSCFHKVFAKKRTWALSIRGPWQNTWQEFLPKKQKFITLTHNRKEVTTPEALEDNDIALWDHRILGANEKYVRISTTKLHGQED